MSLSDAPLSPIVWRPVTVVAMTGTTDRFRLGVDFGTSTTVAALRRANGSVTPLLFDASPLLASGVFAGADAHLLTGADADRAAAAHPAGFDANPKRRIDDGTVWLGERELPVVDLITAVLTRVAHEARRVAGHTPAAAVLTHPATWSHTRLGVLADAARAAGLGDVEFVAEPVAAAAYFATVLGRDIPPGQCLVVYDLGAGTFDVSVMQRTAAAFEVIATDGLPNVGGLDLDAAVIDHARSLTAGATRAWARLDWPETPADQRARRALWHDARAAKEQLSRHATADLHVPLVDADLHLTREEFDKAARPYLERTVMLTRAALRATGLSPEQIAGVFLVGGASRTPLTASLLHRALHIAPTVTDQPELVVAEGSLHTGSAARRAAAARPPRTESPAVDIRPPALDIAARTPAPQLEAPTEPTLGTTAQTPALPTEAVTEPALGDAAQTPAPPAEPALDIAPQRPAPAPEVSPEPAGAPAVPTRNPARRASRGRPVLIAAALLLVVAAVVWLANRDRDAGGASPEATRDPDAIATFEGHLNIVTVAFSPDGKTLATGSGYDKILLWNVATGQNTLTIPGAVYSVAFSPDGKTLATALDETVSLRSAATGQPTAILTGHTDQVHQVMFSPDGQTLATASFDGTIRLWSVATGKATAVLTGHTSYVNGVAFSPDGKTLASAGFDDTVRLWSVATGKAIAVLTGHTDFVTKVAFSPDGATLASTGYDATVRLWSVATGQQTAVLTGHTGHVEAVAFSPDGTTLASAGDDPTVRLWSVATGQTTATHNAGGSGGTRSLAFSPDGKTLAYGSFSNTLLWRAAG